ncbi:hypothetical protein EXE43_19210 [Halorubrum sp. SS5]|nr:hypothetical protein EXE43_19210 [Halorubrum sp. SS5]
MKPSGLLVFGARERVFDDIPPEYEHAVRHVRDKFNRDAFHSAVENPSAYVFFGVAPCYVGIDYDWKRLPSFLGHAVWSEPTEQFVPSNRADKVFARLNLTPVNTFQKEVNVRDFSPQQFELPDSAWYDGPAAGVRIENRSGGNALLTEHTVGEQPIEQLAHDEPPAVASELVTDTRVNRAVEAIEAAGNTVTTGGVQTRVFAMIVREEYVRLDQSGIDVETLRSAVGSVVAQRL